MVILICFICLYFCRIRCHKRFLPQWTKSYLGTFQAFGQKEKPRTLSLGDLKKRRPILSHVVVCNVRLPLRKMSIIEPFEFWTIENDCNKYYIVYDTIFTKKVQRDLKTLHILSSSHVDLLVERKRMWQAFFIEWHRLQMIVIQMHEQFTNTFHSIYMYICMCYGCLLYLASSDIPQCWKHYGKDIYIIFFSKLCICNFKKRLRLVANLV